MATSVLLSRGILKVSQPKEWRRYSGFIFQRQGVHVGLLDVQQQEKMSLFLSTCPSSIRHRFKLNIVWLLSVCVCMFFKF